MPDITMCSNNLCPKSKQCYRFMAEPSEWQSVACFTYALTGDEVDCNYFKPIRKES